METPAQNGTALRGAIGSWSVAFMVLAAAAPLTVVGSIIPIGILLGNGPGLPVMFLLASVILVLFAVGMLRMSEAIPRAGSFFAFIAQGLGRIPGVSAAWLAVVCYSAVQISIFAFLGATASSSIVALGGPDIGWWAFSAVAIVLVGLLAIRRLEFSSVVLIVLLVAESAIVIVLGIAVFTTAGGGIPADPLGIGHALDGSPALGLMFAIAGFIGFESTVVYRNEVRDPARTIRRATYGSAIGIGVFYAFAAVVTVTGFGTDAVVGEIAADPATVLLRLAERYLGPVGGTMISVLFLGSMFAAVLSLHNVIARYLHGMAGAGVLPSSLAAVHKAHGSPYRASLVQLASVVVVLAVFALVGLAPTLVFGWLAGIGTLAIILLMAITAVAVVVFFVRRRQIGWATVVAPVIGGLGLAISAVLIALNFPLLVGDVDAAGTPTFTPLSAGLLSVIVIAAVGGAIWALVLRSRSPERYRRIIVSLEELDH